jgi:hypothetical protein
MQHHTNLTHNEVTYFEKLNLALVANKRIMLAIYLGVNVLLPLVGLSLQVICLFSNTTIMWGQQMQMFYLLYATIKVLRYFHNKMSQIQLLCPFQKGKDLKLEIEMTCNHCTKFMV